MRSYSYEDYSALLRQRAETMPQVIHKEISKIWRACAAEAVLVMAKGVHVDTGMSLASLKPLGSLIKSKLVPLSATFDMLLAESGKPAAGHKNAYGRFENNNATFKSKTFGESLGREAVANKTYNISFGDAGHPRFEFSFNLVVLQYYLHDAGFAPGGAAWNTVEAAKTTFKAEWSKRIKESKLAEKICNHLIRR